MCIRDSDNTKSSGTSQTLLRILRLNTRSVMLFSHTAGNVRLAIDGEGYYEPALSLIHI